MFSIVENTQPSELSIKSNIQNFNFFNLSTENTLKKYTITYVGATLITDESLIHVRENLNITLEELSLCYDDNISSTGILELKSMPRLKLLNLKTFGNEKDEEIENLRQQLPHLMIASEVDLDT